MPVAMRLSFASLRELRASAWHQPLLHSSRSGSPENRQELPRPNYNGILRNCMRTQKLGNKRAAGDGGIGSRLQVKRLWPAAPEHEHWARL